MYNLVEPVVTSDSLTRKLSNFFFPVFTRVFSLFVVTSNVIKQLVHALSVRI